MNNARSSRAGREKMVRKDGLLKQTWFFTDDGTANWATYSGNWK
jgi:hypothetical protein